MRPELVQESFVRIDRCVSDDSKILQTHGIPGGLEVVHEIDELSINVCARPSVGRLREDDICIDRSAMAHTKGRRVEQERRA